MADPAYRVGSDHLLRQAALYLSLTLNRLLVALPVYVMAASCRMPELHQPAYSFLEKGRTGLVWKQPLANRHVLEGDFEIGPVPDPLGGPDNNFFESDKGNVIGKYEIALAARSFLCENTTIEAGIGYRQYDIEGLSPVPDPDINFIVETVDSMQFYLALRRYLDGPSFLSDRWRMFGELGFFLAPGVKVDAELQFLTTTQPFESKADAYYFLSATGGMSYQISDHLVADFGVSWEHLLNPLEVDLTSTVDFGGGQVITIPVQAEMTPKGGVVFVSMTWYP